MTWALCYHYVITRLSYANHTTIQLYVIKLHRVGEGQTFNIIIVMSGYAYISFYSLCFKSTLHYIKPVSQKDELENM